MSANPTPPEGDGEAEGGEAAGIGVRAEGGEATGAARAARRVRSPGGHELDGGGAAAAASATAPPPRALVDFAAALLPPESGGPEPERVAALTERLVARLPAGTRLGSRAAFEALAGVAWARHRRRLRRLDPDRRAALLNGLAATGPAGAAVLDGLKSLVMLAWGADAYAGEVAAVANRAEPARPDPELAITPASELPLLTRCDAVVVGSGAGGAFAARELARAGLETLVVEEGEHRDVAWLRSHGAIDRFAALYRDGGAGLALGFPAIALPVGRAVGGTTVVNSGTCYRPPEGVAQRWHAEAGLALAEPAQLDARLDDVERTLQVAPAPLEVIGRNAELALAGAAALGWHGAPLRRNAPGCQGSCQCAIGCPNNAKLGVHLNALPEACAAGARIASGLRIDRVEVADGRARGVAGRTADGRQVRIEAPIVIVAAGTTQTPPLLRRSGLGRHPHLGRGLSIHPAIGVTGRFAEPVVAWRGVLQSVGVEELHARHGILIEATATPPGMGAVTRPGIGPALVGRLADSEHLATLGAMIADPPSGRVVGARRSAVLYRLARSSGERLAIAAGAMAQVLFAAGAEHVELGAGVPAARSPGEIEAAVERIDPRRLHVAAFHPTGTAAAGADPARHPVDPEGRLRGAEGVWVADGSILPSCPGVNPQLSIMALAAGVGAGAAARP